MKPFQNEIGRKVSLSIAGTIPVIASIKLSLTNKFPDLPAYLDAILHLLDMNEVAAPMNAIRLFWASVAFYLGSLLYLAFRPSVTKDKAIWINSGDYGKAGRELRLQFPNIAEGEINKRLEKVHVGSYARIASLSTAFLIWICALYALSIWIIVFLFLHNVSTIWQSCSPMSIINPGADRC